MNRDEYAQMYRLEDTHWWFLARRNLLLGALKRLISRQDPASRHPLRLLDVGCGTGGTLDRLRPLGTVVGLDLEPLALSFCRERPGLRGVGLVRASATQMPFADASFDFVVAMDVLEHIPDHEAAAREIGRVLRPGGVLLVTVPAYRALWSDHDIALMHQRRYRADEVRRLLQHSGGLRVERLSYTVAALLPAVWAIRMAQRLRRGRAAAGTAYRSDAAPTAPLLNRLLQLLLDAESALVVRVGLSLPFGVSLFAIARKL